MSQAKVTFVFNKLVRDKLPTIMLGDSQSPKVRQLKGEELVRALIAKVNEELDELDPAAESYQSELADLKQAVLDLIEISASHEIVEAQRQKALQKRGGFLGGQYVETLSLAADDPWIDYYRHEPDRFPEQSRP